MTPEQEKNIIQKSKIEADKLWNEIGAYQDFNSDKIYTVEDDIAYLKYLDSTDQLKQTVYKEITDLVKFSTENANKKTYFDKCCKKYAWRNSAYILQQLIKKM